MPHARTHFVPALGFEASHEVSVCGRVVRSLRTGRALKRRRTDGRVHVVSVCAGRRVGRWVAVHELLAALSTAPVPPAGGASMTGVRTRARVRRARWGGGLVLLAAGAAGCCCVAVTAAAVAARSRGDDTCHVWRRTWSAVLAGLSLAPSNAAPPRGLAAALDGAAATARVAFDAMLLPLGQRAADGARHVVATFAAVTRASPTDAHLCVERGDGDGVLRWA